MQTKTYLNKKVLLMMPFFGFIVFGYVLSQIASNVLLVKRLGADFLPYAYVANALFSTFISLGIASVIGRYAVTRIIAAMSCFSALLIAAVYLMMTKHVFIAYPILYVLTNTLYLALSAILMWNLALKVCTPFEGKRLFGYFSLGASLGGITAGLASSLLSKRFGTEILIPLIAISLIFTWILASIIHRQFKDQIMPKIETVKKNSLQSLKEGFLEYRKSRIAKLVSLILMLFYGARLIGDFEFQKILGETFSEDQFSVISGYVSMAENFVLIFVFLFIQRWLLNALGVLKTFFASPAIVLIPFIILFVYPFYAVAIALKVLIKVVNYSTFGNSLHLILTAIPVKTRSAVMTFVGGNAESGGVLITGASLVLLTKFLPNIWLIGIGIAILFLIVILSLKLRKEYIAQITKNLQSEDRDDIHGAIENFAEPSYRQIGVQELMKLMERENLETETVRKIIFSLGKIDNIKVIPSLLDILERGDATVKFAVVEAIHGFTNLQNRLKDLSFTRLNLVESYERVLLKEEDPELKIFVLGRMKDLGTDRIINFLKETMQNKDPNVQYQAIKSMKYFSDRGIIRYVEPFLNNQSIMVRASAIVALWQFLELRPKILKKFVEILAKKEKEYILASFFIIAKLRIHWENAFVEPYTKNADEETRIMAALTLAEIENPKRLDIYADALTPENRFGIILARNIKNLAPNIKNKLFGELVSRGEEAVRKCIAVMEKTYLNFSDEIGQLGSEKENSAAFKA